MAISLASFGRFLPLIMGVIAMPASLLFSPDAFYFGMLPVLAETSTQFGFTGTEMVQAAIVGQMTVGFPISPLDAMFLLISLRGRIRDHIKFTFPWMWFTSLLILVVALITAQFCFDHCSGYRNEPQKLGRLRTGRS